MPSVRTSISIGILGALLFCIAWVSVGVHLWPSPNVADAVADRLGYALRYEIFVVLMLLLGVGAVGNRRFFSDDYIDGSAPEPDSAIDIDRRYVQNTLEQSLLAVISHLSLALVVPIESIQIIPILVALFVIGRICFWIGYHISPQGRAFGFAVTVQPTVVVFVYVIWRVMT